VLLPGFALDAAVMAAGCEPAFARSKSIAGQRIYLDLPGTGGSLAGEPRSEAVLEAVQATVADLIGATPFLLVGHSYGSYLAAGLARWYPDRVAGLFLISSGLRIRPGDRDLTGVPPSVAEPGWLDEVPDDLHEHFVHGIGHQRKAVAGRVAAAFDRRGPIDDDYLDALRPNGYRLADEDSAACFAGPVTLLSGRRDRIAGYRDAFAALERYPDGTFTALAEAGHYLPFEQPGQFATALLDWLAAVEKGRPDQRHTKGSGLAGDGA
jgi:pimeloyl-ACP methyl ester carboxylesterase